MLICSRREAQFAFQQQHSGIGPHLLTLKLRPQCLRTIHRKITEIRCFVIHCAGAVAPGNVSHRSAACEHLQTFALISALLNFAKRIIDALLAKFADQ